MNEFSENAVRQICLTELIEIRVLSLAACKMIRLFHLQMLHCQKH